MPKKIVLLASGNGTNVEAICKYFEKRQSVIITKVLTNNPKAGVLKRIVPFQIEGVRFDRKNFEAGIVTSELQDLDLDLIVLAGFLWKIPAAMVAAFPQKIINIHPALLPKYGGKGMYGMNIHNAVKKNSESKTGITIHYVNENYDEGAIIFQKETLITPKDSLEVIAQKVHQLEHYYYPRILESLLLNTTIDA